MRKHSNGRYECLYANIDVNQMMNIQLALSKTYMLSLYKRYLYLMVNKSFFLDLSNDIDSITFKIDHSDGRQITLVLPSSTTFKELYQQVSERLSLPSIYLVHNNQTLKLDDDNHFLTLKQFKFSTNHTEILESYPLTKKFERR